mgnify:CR=1 FL=1
MNNKLVIDTNQLVDLLASNEFLSELDPDAILELVKSNRSASKRILQGGFRDVVNPMVQRRLIDEIKRSGDFCVLLVRIWRDGHIALTKTIEDMSVSEVSASLNELAAREGGRNLCIAMLLDGRKKLAKLAQNHKDELLSIKRAEEPTPSKTAEPAPKQSADSDLKTKLKETKNLLREAQKQLTQARRDLAKSAQKIEKLEKENAKQKEKIAQLDREVKKSRESANKFLRERDKEKERTEEQRKIVSDLRSQLDNQQRPERPAAPHEQAWKDTVNYLIKEGKSNTAAEFLEAFAKNDAHNCVTPLELLVDVYRKTGAHGKHAEALKMLSDCHLRCSRIVEAIEAAAKALNLIPKWPPAVENIKKALSRISTRNQHRICELRKLLHDRSAISEEAANEVIGLAYSESLALAEALCDHLQTSRPNSFQLTYGSETKAFTPQAIVEAVHRNDEKTIKFLRGALKNLKKEDKHRYNELKSEIDHIDDGCWTVIACKGTVPIVMDASNVAHAHRHKDGRPMLKNIRLIRSALYRNKYFPVYICSDANLRYIALEGEREFDRMYENGEIDCADGGSDADERIISLAKRHNCKVVTRDLYRDVDPEGKVQKIGYEVYDDYAEVLEY